VRKEQERQAMLAEEKAKAEQAAREQAAREQAEREQEAREQAAAVPPEDKAVIDQIFATPGKHNPVLYAEKMNEAKRYFRDAEAAEKTNNAIAFELYSSTIQSVTWAVRYGPKETGFGSVDRKLMFHMLQQSLSKRREIAESVLGSDIAASDDDDGSSSKGKKGGLKGLFGK